MRVLRYADSRAVSQMALAFISFAAGSKLYVKRFRKRARSLAYITCGLVFFEMLLGTVVMFGYEQPPGHILPY